MNTNIFKNGRILVVLIVFSLFGIVACSGSPTPQASIVISTKCELSPGDTVAVALEGSFPESASIEWSATKGVVNPISGVNVAYTAPISTGSDIILAKLSYEGQSYTYSQNCVISSSLPPEITIDNVISITPTGENEVTEVTIESTTPPTLTPTPEDIDYQIAITEVMADPCGPDTADKWNEFVELYNYGDIPIDVKGWHLIDWGTKGTPDSLVSWETNFPGIPLNPGVVLDSTIIPPKGYAVVMSPVYLYGESIYRTPYDIPPGVVILTVENGDRIGDDEDGLIGSSEGLDCLALYRGTDLQIEEIVSTYGSPSYPISIKDGLHDDLLDGIPLFLGECRSAERIYAAGDDKEFNWRRIDKGTPGKGPY